MRHSISSLTGKMPFDVHWTAKFFILQRFILPYLRTKRFKVHFSVLPRRLSEISREISAAALRAKNTNAFFGLIVILTAAMIMAAVPYSYAQQESTVAELIESLEVGAPVYYENLTIIPVYTSKVKDMTGYTTLEEALQDKLLGITEVEGGQVPQVKLANRSDKYIYIMGGEILTGCKQDRLVGRDVLIRPKAKNVVVPVYCVEQGRWTYQSNEFYSKENLGTHKLRAEAQIARSESQSNIWNEVSQMNEKMGVTSSSNAYQQVYEDEAVNDKIVLFERKFQNIPQLYDDTIGIVVGVGSRIVSADIFVNPELFKKMWPKLLKSSVLSAISDEQAGSVTQEHVAEFLRKLHNRQYKQNTAVDLGTEFLAVDREVNVNALAYRNAVIHLSAFSQQEEVISDNKPNDGERRIPVMRRGGIE